LAVFADFLIFAIGQSKHYFFGAFHSYYSFGFCRHTKKSNAIQVGFFWVAVGGQGGFAPLQAR
jgi:hypothetical protein